MTIGIAGIFSEGVHFSYSKKLKTLSLVVTIKTRAKSRPTKLTTPTFQIVSISSKNWTLPLPEGALTTFPCKFGLFFPLYGVHIHPVHPLATPMTTTKMLFLCHVARLAGDILVGFSSDEPAGQFSTAARDTMWTVTGVDVRPVVYRGKFVFIAQIGSPQRVWTIHKA